MTDLFGWDAFEQRHLRIFWDMCAFWCQNK